MPAHTRKEWISRLAVGSLAASLVLPVLAQSDGFSSGSVRVSGSASGTSFGGQSYLRVGVGVGYYPIDGLELGLDATSRIGSSYNVHELEPSITYVLATFDSIKPYGGILYRRSFIEGQDDLSAYGGRAGVLLQQSGNIHVRAGLVGIRYQDCDNRARLDCSDFYPELSVGFYF